MSSDKRDVSAYDAFKAADDGERISVAELRRQIAEEEGYAEIRRQLDAEACPDCGRPEGSFACRIRHIHMNTGDAKASRDVDGGSR